MKLAAIALDYDGTIATNGVMDPSVRAAVGDIVANIDQTIRARYERIPSDISAPREAASAVSSLPDDSRREAEQLSPTRHGTSS